MTAYWEMEANREALAGIEIGRRVRFFRRGRFEMTGELISFEDDSHEYQGQVDGWAKIKLRDGSARTFRRNGGLGPGSWFGTAPSLRSVGALRIELA